MNQGSTQQRPPLPPSKVEAIKKVHGQLVDTLERIKTRLQSPSVEPDKVPLLLSKQAEFTNQLNIIHDKFKDIVGSFPTQSTTTANNRSSTIPLSSRPIQSTPRPQQSASITVPTQPSRTPPASSNIRPPASIQTTPAPRPISSQNVYYTPNPTTVIRPQSTPIPHYQNISAATQSQKMPVSMIQQSTDHHQPLPTTSGFSAIQQLVPPKPQYQHLHSTYSTTTPNVNASFLRFPPQVQPPITTFRHPQVTAPMHSSYPIVSNGSYYPSQGILASRPSATAIPQHPSQLMTSPYQMSSIDTKPIPASTSHTEIHPSKSTTIAQTFIPDEPRPKAKKHSKKKSIEDLGHIMRQSKGLSTGRIPRSTTPVLRSASITKGIETSRRANMLTSAVGIQGASQSTGTTLSMMSGQFRGIDSIMTIDHSRILTTSKSLIQTQGKSIQGLIKQTCPFISFDNCMELERAISIVAEQFVDTISSSLCQLAMLHSSPHIKTDDVYYLLEHKFGINLPFSSVSIEDRIISLSKKSNITTQQYMVSLLEDSRINSRSRKRMPLFPKDCLVNYSESTLLNRMRKALKSSRSDKKTKPSQNEANHSSNSVHASSDTEETIPRQDVTSIDQLDHMRFMNPHHENYLLNNETVT